MLEVFRSNLNVLNKPDTILDGIVQRIHNEIKYYETDDNNRIFNFQRILLLLLLGESHLFESFRESLKWKLGAWLCKYCDQSGIIYRKYYLISNILGYSLEQDFKNSDFEECQKNYFKQHINSTFLKYFYDDNNENKFIIDIKIVLYNTSFQRLMAMTIFNRDITDLYDMFETIRAIPNEHFPLSKSFLKSLNEEQMRNLYEKPEIEQKEIPIDQIPKIPNWFRDRFPKNIPEIEINHIWQITYLRSHGDFTTQVVLLPQNVLNDLQNIMHVNIPSITTNQYPIPDTYQNIESSPIYDDYTYMDGFFDPYNEIDPFNEYPM